MIPQAAPHLRIARFREEIDAAVASVVASSNYILGPKVRQFEEAFAATVGVGHCVGVASGTDALILALRAVGVGPGDEVITVSMTMAGTAQAILMSGAIPRFVDVDPVTRVVGVEQVQAAITSATRAILPVHLFGHPAPMPALRQFADSHGLALVEDCAQAHGGSLPEGRLGSFGHAAAFSFYPTKNLGAIGDAGAVVTNDEAVAERVRSLRAYGWESGDRVSHRIAANSRLDEVQAAILLALLPHLDAGNSERRDIAAYFTGRFSTTNLTLPVMTAGSVHHQYAIGVEGRDQAMVQLSKRGVGTAVHYTPPLHRQPAFARFATSELPVTDNLAATVLSLPIQPEVAGPNRELIADIVLEVVGHK